MRVPSPLQPPDLYRQSWGSAPSVNPQLKRTAPEAATFRWLEAESSLQELPPALPGSVHLLQPQLRRAFGAESTQTLMCQA